jgi:pimeloyl-ACP methyl ester carboxylesterase
MKRLIFAIPLIGLSVFAQNPPYDKYPDAEPPYYRIRYEASTKPGELIFPVKYTIWIPPGVETLRGVVVHQHGCGEGSCKSGLTGAWDLHWQALAKKHGCALMAPSYEQPQKADCQMWCDPRNGSDAAFRKALEDLGRMSGHPELASVPWALWGHSGGGHWAGGMAMLHPQRCAAVWLRSGVPLLEPNPERPQIKPYTAIPARTLKVPIMCNPGTKEGVTVKTGRFAKVWPANEAFLGGMRSQSGLVGVAVDPLSAHECGNQRYMAILWLDACLKERLPDKAGAPLKPMPTDDVWLAPFLAKAAVAEAQFTGDGAKASWIANESVAKLWTQYVTDTNVPDATPPPAPINIKVLGKTVSWEAEADLESGLAHFIIRRDGKFLAKVEGPKNRYGRQLFQGLQYSDTPTFPLQTMTYTDNAQEAGKTHAYDVVAVNTAGLKSE